MDVHEIQSIVAGMASASAVDRNMAVATHCRTNISTTTTSRLLPPIVCMRRLVLRSILHDRHDCIQNVLPSNMRINGWALPWHAWYSSANGSALVATINWLEPAYTPGRFMRAPFHVCISFIMSTCMIRLNHDHDTCRPPLFHCPLPCSRAYKYRFN